MPLHRVFGNTKQMKTKVKWKWKSSDELKMRIECEIDDRCESIPYSREMSNVHISSGNNVMNEVEKNVCALRAHLYFA